MAIALLTDFGTTDYFAGAIKGAILRTDPNSTIVDITHDIPKHDVKAAGFTLAVCFEDFPAGTIFVAVVDPGVGSERRALVVEAHDRIFVAPDNGILSRILDKCKSFSAFEIVNEKYFGPQRSMTFHGRDIFAPAAAYISLGVPIKEFGPEIASPVVFPIAQPQRISENEITGEIIHVDHFGNLVTNLIANDIPPKFELSINDFTISVSHKTYASASSSKPFLIEGSAGFVEIASNGLSAAAILGAATGQRFSLMF